MILYFQHRSIGTDQISYEVQLFVHHIVLIPPGDHFVHWQ